MNQAEKYIQTVKGKKIALVGMGVANTPCAKFLAQHGIEVYACDKRDKEYIGKEVCDELEALGVKFSLGDNYLDILPEMDIVFRSHGILPFQNEWIGECIERGVTVTTEMEVFFEYCPCKIFAITGSNGKTTTTTLISKMLEAEGNRVFLGGNIGKALMPTLDEITENDIAVVELSSFQLLTMGNLRNKPDVAVVTNIECTHQDHHISLDEYVDAKRNILIYQNENQRTVLNADCDYSIGNRVYHDMRYDVRGKLFEFSIKHPVENGAFMDTASGDIYYCENGEKTLIMNKNDIVIPGDHNIENYCTAISAVWGCVKPETIKNIAQTFGGVEHRIEFVREYKGVKYYNDSIATSPSRVISGLKAFGRKIIVIMGGSDKGNDLTEMVPYILKYCKVLVLNGTTANRIYDAVRNNSRFEESGLKVIMTDKLENALAIAKEEAEEGDIVSLCPACPAFDQFKTFEYRGRKYKEMVNSFDD
ncbi:MAG: UDP-N-acetylmuramoyl-L-alanine--D-glutamate ligase [Ruminococcaceae bacterium]|nr:UDP-N-acetylmuramoyl-L-alanine--D-glutamate ligase [Oscillospiraceae bacterium]